MFDLRFQQIIHTVSFRCLTFISPDLKRFQHETSTTLTATTNSSSHENTLFQRAHARFPLARGGYNNSRQCQSHFRSPTETPVSGLLLETNNKTIKLKCSAFDTPCLDVPALPSYYTCSVISQGSKLWCVSDRYPLNLISMESAIVSISSLLLLRNFRHIPDR